MKKKILPMFFLLSLAIGLCIAVSGCSALKLKAPANLRVSDDGFLSIFADIAPSSTALSQPRLGGWSPRAHDFFGVVSTFSPR